MSSDETEVEEDEMHFHWTRARRGLTVESPMNEETSVVVPFFVPQSSEEDDLPVVGPERKNSPSAPLYSKTILIQELRDAFRDEYTASFKFKLIRYLCEVVPRLFTPVDQPGELLTPTFDEVLIQDLIFEPLETVLIGETTNDFKAAIALTDVPTGNCGRVFKTGEATYTCRDCGADPTCVLCIECFNNSEHKNHRYKMSSSSGGGYCDCGDVEAWKKDALCSKHLTAASSEGSSLPPQKETLATWLIGMLLHYADDVLSNEYAVSTDSIPIIRDAQGVLDEKFLKYSIIIYNDEIHTFEIVIHVLTRVFHLDKRNAAEFTNKIHNEGRAIIRSTTFEECARLKNEVIRCTQRTSGKPLRVDIRQSVLVAHQHFAGHLLKWISNILNLSSAYRTVFHSIVSKKIPLSRTLLQTILLEDTKSWKYVRELWHHLLIAGLLKEYNLKKDFATVFADCYGDLMTEFSQDDHDHIYSVTSLSVQILTVRTLAHYLIGEKRLLFNVMRAIMSEIEPRVVDGKVQYERKGPGIQLRRTLYALVDIKYLLTSTPNPWTPELRQQFMDGFTSLAKFCRFIHESDPTVRRTRDHVEYDPDWETAFNISIKLSPVLTLIFDWCASDEDVCTKAYRKVLVELTKLKTSTALDVVVREVANHSATCYDYDISVKPVSIYLALTRLLSGIVLAVQGQGRSQWGKTTYRRFGPSPEFIMEAPLRAVTLVAQRNVGMWTKNGVSLLNQLYFYQSVRCRTEMYDRDILSLQIAATEIESNEFLIHLMNRFNVLYWMEEDSATEDEYTPLLVEEFLLLVITLVGGRFLPGVGDVSREDCIRKQIIQALCIGCMTHSELNRHLDEDVQGETGIESVVRDVVNVKKMKNGDVYELKPEMYADYDVFYYHYIREEISKAEEAQRARKLALKEPDFFPPPKLPPFTHNFTMLINLLKSDVLLSVFKTTIQRSMVEGCLSYSDAQLRKVLHLIGYGLNEELEQNEVDHVHFFQFAKALCQWEIIELLTLALDTGRVATHKSMILWVITTYGKLRPSNPSALTTEQQDDQQEEELRIRKEKAAAAKARSMASIFNLQNKFRTVNADLLRDDDASSTEEFTEVDQVVEAVCLGTGRTTQASTGEALHCILCKDAQDVSDEATTPFVAACYIHPSSVLAQKSVLLKTKMEFPEMRPDLPAGIFIGACGHVMHKTCWKKYFDSIVQKERRRPYRQLQLFDTERNECLCPMCSCLHNMVLPVLPSIMTLEVSTSHVELEPSNSQFEKWLDLLFSVRKRWRNTNVFPTRETLVKEGSGLPELYDLLWAPQENDRHAKTVWQQHDGYEEFLDSMSDYALALGEKPLEKAALYVALPQAKYIESLQALWGAVAFTITSMEMSHRVQGIAFFGEEVPSSTELTLKYLIRLGGNVLNAPSKSAQGGVPAGLHALEWVGFIDEKPKVPLEEVDAFLLLVIGTYTLPFLFTGAKTVCDTNTPQTGNVTNIYVFRLMIVFHMIQILSQEDMYELISNNQDRWSAEVDNGKPQAPETHFSKLCRKIWSIDTIPICWHEILQHLEDRIVPFVTCCCKFYECYTGIDAVHFQRQGTSLPNMLKYISQPSDLEAFFASEKLLNLCLKWVEVSQHRTDTIFPRTIAEFNPLPNDYLDLMNSVADFACPTNRVLGQESRHPTICLVCGKILCSQSPCCQTELNGASVGACTLHAMKCGFGTSIFLRIRDSKCFLLSSEGKKGTYVPPPYVDEYGETDQGLRRGNPLRLSKEKMESLRKLWINHSIPSEIVRINERNASAPSMGMFTDWSRL